MNQLFHQSTHLYQTTLNKKSVRNRNQTSASGASDGGGLPEIAAVDDTAVEALPDVIAAE